MSINLFIFDISSFLTTQIIGFIVPNKVKNL